jgi:hypothetical protein
MAQDLKVLHSIFGAAFAGKTKALTSCGWRAFELALFFTLAGFLR